MAQMTRKGQKFVGREVSKLMRKGPSSGPQKGRKMHQKQAVAVALNVARRKRYKVPPPPSKREAVLYRDPEYGALALISEDGGFVTYNHNSVDAPAVFAVLERSARPEQRDDGGTFWRPIHGAHPAAVEANVLRAVQAIGYVEDPLAERAVVSVSRATAMKPDLPSDGGFHLVHEPLEAGLRRHVEVAFAALQEHGRATPPTVRFHGRPNARDSFGRPLPFLIARAFIATDEPAASVERSLREALRPVEQYLVRATVMEGADHFTVEVALAPSASICESYMDASIPAFESQGLSGARTVWMSLGAPLAMDEARDISELAAMSTGAVGLRTERNGRAVVAHIPSSHPGSYVGDHAFQERLQWLVGILDPWDPEVYDIGEQMAVQAGAPSQRDGLVEADIDIRGLERSVSAGNVEALLRLRHAQLRAGKPIVPGPEDVLAAASELDPFFDVDRSEFRVSKALTLRSRKTRHLVPDRVVASRLRKLGWKNTVLPGNRQALVMTKGGLLWVGYGGGWLVPASRLANVSALSIVEADARIRALQRQAATGDRDAALRLQRELLRAGHDDLAPDDPPSGMDADAVRDLELFIDNDHNFYRWQRQLEKRYLQRMTGPASLTKAGKPRSVHGTYDRLQAAKGYMNLLNDAARAYVRQAGGGSVRHTFPKNLREFLAMQLAKRFERRVRDGELTEAILEKALDEADARIRELERRAAAGDLDAKRLLRRELQRAGQVAHPKSVRALIGDDLDDAGIEWDQYEPENLTAKAPRDRVIHALRTAGWKESHRPMDPDAAEMHAQWAEMGMKPSAGLVLEKMYQGKLATVVIYSEDRPGTTTISMSAVWNKAGRYVPYYNPGKRYRFEAEEMVKMKGSGKTMTTVNPKGSIAQVGEPKSPKDAAGDECPLDQLRKKLAAAKEKYKAGEKASKQQSTEEGRGVPFRRPFLGEADARGRELERAVAAGDVGAKPALKAHRIRTGEARRFDRVVALVSSEAYPRGVWSGKWAHVGRWEPSIEDERKSGDYGMDPDKRGDRFDAPWIVGVGAGYSTINFLVYANNESEAVEACEEEWPEEFADWHPDYEGEPDDGGPEIRVIARCETWEIARRHGYGGEEELLDGTVVDSV